MKQAIWAAFLAAGLAGGAARAQDTFVQIEAQPSLAEAEERARAYAGAFPNVQGYRLDSGWYGIVLGPFTPGEAARQLDLLRTERLIPADSFIALGPELGRRFWPAGVQQAPAAAETAAVPAPEPEPAPAADETPDEARISESLLLPEERQEIQSAMQYFGVYEGQIDGSFGKGTRAAMAAWQEANGYSPTGILTTRERRALIEGWRGERAELGLTPVSEAEAGIEIELPLGLVAFDGYAPPFVRYTAKDGSGWQVLLISRAGDARTLAALHERLQAFEIMPLTGERTLGRTGFTITGADSDITSYAQAEIAGGLVKGFVLVAPSGEAARAERVLAAMRASFRAVDGQALDETLGEPSAVSAADLTAGLEVRKPNLSRSGVFIDAQGSVLTTTEVLQDCGRITLDSRHEATLAFRDDALGIAVLRPARPLAPRAVAELQPAPLRAEANVALAGYSYGDRLSAPVVSFGTLAEPEGLNGEPGLARLAMATLPGDAGGAVLDASGAMAGMLLPRADDPARALPADVSFAAQAGAIAAALAGNGVAVAPSARTGSLASEDLAKLARDMTVLVSCWK
jgi:peptidoglycan hydrolase-like protein with peptidoglycan-binding domain